MLCVSFVWPSVYVSVCVSVCAAVCLYLMSHLAEQNKPMMCIAIDAHSRTN